MSVTQGGGLHFTDNAELAVISPYHSRPIILDTIANVSWQLAGPDRRVPAVITGNGHLAAALDGARALHIWDLSYLPDGPAATARWLDTLTNATTTNGSIGVTWPSP